jgi:hypothetical protein
VKIINKLNWLVTWVTLVILKKVLSKRLRGDAAASLQPVKTKQVSIFNRIDFILEQSNNKRVLHVGFTDYPYTAERINNKSLLHLQLRGQTSALAGVDFEANAIDEYILLTGDTNVFCGDITKAYSTLAIAFKPEIILLTEVLEHLQNPYKAIDVLYNSFNNNTAILVTVPNYAALNYISASLNKTESIHPHHHWYFSPYTLSMLFDEKRFVLEQLHFGMYYQYKKKINPVMQHFSYNADCIIAIYRVNKK